MLYDVRLELHYDYDAPVQGGRHLIRVAPISVPGAQRVIAASLSFSPKPDRESHFTDFFGNPVSMLVFRHQHDSLDVRLAARVSVEDTQLPADLSPTVAELDKQIGRIWSLSPHSPHHFLAASERVWSAPEITAYAEASLARTETVHAAALDLCLSIHRDFRYEKGATDVGTTPLEAFALKKGVCQDFAHVMIAALRGVGIPAGYVSGFLRTIPPKGKQRLAGADAMHAWVRAWCGRDVGWLEYDPTNAMMAGADHIVIGYGRDYADISPIVGVLRTSGGHEARQSVDVLRVD